MELELESQHIWTRGVPWWLSLGCFQEQKKKKNLLGNQNDPSFLKQLCQSGTYHRLGVLGFCEELRLAKYLPAHAESHKPAWPGNQLHEVVRAKLSLDKVGDRIPDGWRAQLQVTEH